MVGLNTRRTLREKKSGQNKAKKVDCIWHALLVRREREWVRDVAQLCFGVTEGGEMVKGHRCEWACTVKCESDGTLAWPFVRALLCRLKWLICLEMDARHESDCRKKYHPFWIGYTAYVGRWDYDRTHFVEPSLRWLHEAFYEYENANVMEFM